MFGLFEKKVALTEKQILRGGSDAHSHILFGVDDGVKTAEESLNILALLEKEGLRELWLTPHTMEDVPNTGEALKARFEELSKLYKGSIELHLASEYMMDELFLKHPRDRDLLTHKEQASVLLETSAWSAPYRFWEILEDTKRAGYRPILAHPERYEYMDMKDYRRLNAMGIRLQLNYPSLLGYFGENAKKKAERLLKEGMYSMTGSDCHRMTAIARLLEAREIKEKTAVSLHNLIVK